MPRCIFILCCAREATTAVEGKGETTARLKRPTKVRKRTEKKMERKGNVLNGFFFFREKERERKIGNKKWGRGGKGGKYCMSEAAMATAGFLVPPPLPLIPDVYCRFGSVHIVVMWGAYTQPVFSLPFLRSNIILPPAARRNGVDQSMAHIRESDSSA